jgi:ATP-dependent helicase HrpA
VTARGAQDDAARAAALRSLLDECQLQDRPRLHGYWRQWQASVREEGAAARAAGVWSRLEQQAAASAAVTAARRLPLDAAARMPEGLPIAACRDDIARAIGGGRVTIVCGSTGSGKSTQLPKLALALGRGVLGRIGVTQPRRLAARAIAGRLAAELDVELGGLVGFQTRFEQQLSAATRVKVMTDGILLQELARDRQLLAYDTLIIDEVHERSLNIDFLLGYLRKLLMRRDDLKLILTSATLEAERCAEFFGGAAIVHVPGRGFPVDIRHRPPPAGQDSEPTQAILQAIAELDAEDYGDILVFLPGEREIAELGEALAKAGLRNTEVLPLYARLTAREQQRVFAPHQRRHVILATNVAETSLTVPGVRHVIDTGLVRLATYSPRSRLQRLPTVPNSQASAAQRAGRCGRERPGICIRLYGEDDFAARPAHTPPELQRSNLAGVLLRLAELRLGPIESFSFLDPPEQRAINDGYTLLRELGAFDADNRLTRRGAAIARLPLDPRLGAVLLAAADEGAVAEVLVIVAALSVGDVRDWPRDQRQAADAAHAADADRRSEFMWFLSAWRVLQDEFKGRSRRQQLAWCRARFWSWRRAREWLAVHAQLLAALGTLGLKPNEQPANYRAVHTALLAGFATRIGRLGEDQRYVGVRGGRFRLHPTSSLRAAPPRWVMAAELTETTAAYARIAARIETPWVVKAAAPLIRRSHAEPYWDVRQGRVLAREEQSLQGLILSADGVVDYARVDAAAARGIFIEKALVEGELGAEPPFLVHNRDLLAQVRQWEERVRRHDLLADPAQLADFYRERLPADIGSRRQLLAWLREERGRDALLSMREADATQAQWASLGRHLFPESLVVAGLTLRLHYRFEPGAEEDGVTVEVPASVLHQVEAAHFERLVPGLLRDKVHALLKALPKAQRRVVSPLNAFAASLTAAVEDLDGPLTACLGREIERMTGQRIEPAAWRADELPAHLMMRYQVTGAEGEKLAAGRDLPVLARQLARAARVAFEQARWESGARSVGDWTFGVLPAQVSTVARGHAVLGHPALRDEGGEVVLVVLSDAEEALATHRAGVVALLMLNLGRELKGLRRRLADFARVALQARALGWSQPFDEWLLRGAVAACVGEDVPRDAESFARLLAAARRGVTAHFEDAARLGAELFAQAVKVQQLIEDLGPRMRSEVAADLRAQLHELVAPGSVADALRRPPSHGARFLRAMERRIERLALDPDKDFRKFSTLGALLARAAQLLPRTTQARRERVCYLLQELRVAVFAPEVRTAESISVKRMEAMLEEIAGCVDG